MGGTLSPRSASASPRPIIYGGKGGSSSKGNGKGSGLTNINNNLVTESSDQNNNNDNMNGEESADPLISQDSGLKIEKDITPEEDSNGNGNPQSHEADSAALNILNGFSVNSTDDLANSSANQNNNNSSTISQNTKREDPSLPAPRIGAFEISMAFPGKSLLPSEKTLLLIIPVFKFYPQKKKSFLIEQILFSKKLIIK